MAKQRFTGSLAPLNNLSIDQDIYGVKQFNALVEDLQVAMDKSGIPSRTQNKLLALLAPMQRIVVIK